MAIRIPILTSFDPKGLKQANAQFAKLSGSVSSLGRNFAVAGVALTAITAGLARTVQTASSYSESINAVNVAFGKSAQGIIDFGKTAATTLGVSQVDFNNAAVRFSAFAERIVGSGGDASKFIAEISTRASDFASVFNIEVSEALQVFQSGLAGEAEPLKRFGINLLDSEVKAYAMANGIGEVGRQLTETEKVQARYGLLMQATGKTQGDFANTSDGLANQLRILTAEVSNTEIEIGNQLLPVMAELLPIVRDLVRDLGTQLVAAVKAVDWKALTTDLMNTLSFFIRNATAIAQLTVAVFAINTAFKAFQVISGLVSVALSVKTWWLAKVATGMTATTIATTALSSAMRLIPWVAAAAGIALVATEIANSGPRFDAYKKQFEELDTSVTNINPSMSAFALTALDIQAKYLPVVKLIRDLAVAMGLIPKEINTTINVDVKATGSSVLDDYGYNIRTGQPIQAPAITTPTITTPTPTGGGAPKATQGPLQQIIAESKQNAKVIQKQSVLERKGLSAEVAAWVTSSNKPVKAANEAIARISKNGNKAIGNLTKAYTNSAAGQAAAAAASASEITESFSTSYDDTADLAAAAAAAEAAALAERERVFKSFTDSVKAAFAGMKNGIINAFDLTQLGGSSNAITRNMDKLLVRLRSFADNVKNLASMGLNPALLQQVISAGPMGGARLAEALVMGGAGGLSALNAGYSEFGALSSQIAQTGTESLFGTGAQQSIYNINVDGGVGSGSTIGKAIVDAIKAYERTSGAVWQGA
jgi:hypothetical protein